MNRNTEGLIIPKNHNFRDDESWEKLNRIRKDTALWLPNRAYILHLRNSRVISSGSVYYDKLQDFKQFVVSVYKWAVEGAGIIAGIIHGVLLSIHDIFADAVELVKFFGKLFRSLFTGKFLDHIIDLFRKIVKFISNLDEIAEELYKEFKEKWCARDAWDRGYFRGSVVGYLLGTSVLIVLTFGAGVLAKIMGKSMRFAGIAQKVAPKIKRTAEMISKASKLPRKYKAKMLEEIKRKLKLVDLDNLVPQPQIALAGTSTTLPGNRLLTVSPTTMIESRALDRGLPEGTHSIIEPGQRRMSSSVPLKRNQEILRAAMIKKFGKDIIRPGEAAHHIIPKGAVPNNINHRAKKAWINCQNIIERANIRIDSWRNGVALPQSSKIPNPDARQIHDTIHTSEYFIKLEKRLKSAEKYDNVRGELRSIQIRLMEDGVL